MARVRRLGVWLADRQIAVLRRTGPARVSCEYSPDVLAECPIGTPLLSCSLPVQRGSQPAWPFVTGLLPEGHHRTSMSRLAGVDTLDALGMLARFGRDVAGALVIAREPSDRDQAPSTELSAAGAPGAAAPGVAPLSEDDLADEVASLPARTLALHDDSELSLAGLEDKILLVRTDAGWGRPVRGYPSTHILKIDNRVHRGTVVLEHDCLQLARRAGISSADCALTRVGDADCIVVERYDRTRDADGVFRIHQEDTCQALGIDPAARPEGRAKYEAHGGPTLEAIARLLTAFAADIDAELTRLLERVIFTVVIGDSDAHGKNISLLHPTPEHVTLAPLYDTVPTALWPRLRPEAAMTINGRTFLADVTAADLVTEARRWGLGVISSRRIVADVGERLRTAAAGIPEREGFDLSRLLRTNLDRLAR